MEAGQSKPTPWVALDTVEPEGLGPSDVVNVDRLIIMKSGKCQAPQARTLTTVFRSCDRSRRRQLV
jgi:hypothetical protein